MQIERLVNMANDIAAFFQGTALADEAAASVASHLQRFWDPRMRRELIAHWRAGGAGLSEIARRAVAQMAQTASPPAP